MSLRRVLGQFIRFAGVGVLGTGAHFLTLALLVEFGLRPDVATAIGAVIGTLVNYVLNYRYTFRSHASHRIAASRFVTISAVGWAINAAMFHFLHMTMMLHLWVAQILTTGAVLFWNFAGNRVWTFGENHHG